MLGDRGKQDDFSFSCTLLNTWTAVRSIESNTFGNDDFLTFCLKLSFELYEYACTLQPIHRYT